MATGTATLVDSGGAGTLRKLTWTCVATSGGVVTSDETVFIGGFIVGIETDPGSPAPTDNWDLTITNARGTDVLNGAGADRDTTNSEWAFPTFNGVPVMIPIRDTKLTLNCSNMGNGGAAVISLYILQP